MSERPPLTPAASAFLERCRVARLATADRSARPHVIPLCYCLLDGELYFVVDEKRKAAGKMLKRLRNILDNPEVALVADVYDEDWTKLEYVLVRGRAAEVSDPAEFDRALARLRERYPQYRTMRLERGRNPLVRITPRAVNHWRAAG